jgi:hypothetical protein
MRSLFLYAAVINVSLVGMAMSQANRSGLSSQTGSHLNDYLGAALTIACLVSWQMDLPSYACLPFKRMVWAVDA